MLGKGPEWDTTRFDNRPTFVYIGPLAGGRRTAFLAPAWGVGVVRGAGRRGSVACGVAQRALLCAFMFVFMSFLFFRLYFRCILAFLYLCVLPYMA